MIKSVSQIDSTITACCRFMQPIRKKLIAAMDWQQEAIGKKLALDFFVNFFNATSTVSLFLQLFYSSLFLHRPFNRLALINQSYFN